MNHIQKLSNSSIEYLSPEALKANPRNARTHSKKQIRQVAKSIKQFGFIIPVVVDENDILQAGHARVEAAKFLGLAMVPVIRVSHLSEAEKRAYMLADNKLAENAGWDRAMLAIELSELALLLPELEFDLTITGFDVGEIDQINVDHSVLPPPKSDDGGDDDIPAVSPYPVSQRGDLWLLGPHRVACGDARSALDIDALMQGDKARVAFLDPPYNVRIEGHVQGRGAIKHDEFAFASGEMSSIEFKGFLNAGVSQAARVSCDGAVHYICMDWRHVRELLDAAEDIYSSQLNVCVWVKTSAGLGSFYRSQHEFVYVFKVGDAPHRNGVELGRHGRSRSNVWTYAGVNAFKAGGREELAWHPTVKPLAMVADALRDCSLRGEIVLDTFLGSGTTLMAAEKVGRVCRGLDYEPKYVDVAIKRWQAFTKLEAIHAVTGKTFAETAEAQNLERASNILDQASNDLG
jgi:DNA modification methylase